MINSQAKEYASVLYELSYDKKQIGSIFESLTEVLENREIYNFFNHLFPLCVGCHNAYVIDLSNALHCKPIKIMHGNNTDKSLIF